MSMVRPHKRKDRVVWQAYAQRNNKKIYIATFDNKVDAENCCAQHDKVQQDITTAVEKSVAASLRFHADLLDPPKRKKVKS